MSVRAPVSHHYSDPINSLSPPTLQPFDSPTHHHPTNPSTVPTTPVLGLGLPLAILAGCGPDKEITGAVIGQILVVVIGAPLSVLGISMMRKRPALHEVRLVKCY